MSKPPVISVTLYGMPDLYLQRNNTFNVPDKVNRIIDFICFQKGVSKFEIMRQNRKAEVNYTRQLVMYVVRNRTPLSLPQIGAIFSREHTSVLHSLKAIQNYIDTDPKKGAEIKRFIEVIY